MKGKIRRLPRLTAATLVIVFHLGLTVAQPPKDFDWSYRGEVFGGAGWGRLYRGPYKDVFGGLSLVGGVDLRPFTGAWSGLGFQARFDYLRSESDLWKDIKMVSANVQYFFGRKKLQPYVYGGVCLVRTERTIVVTYGPGPGQFYQERYQDPVSKTGFDLGAGLRIALNRHLSVRPEVRIVDTTPGTGLNLGIPQFLTSLGYSW